MAKYLTKNLINLSNQGFRPNRSSELRLNHTEYAFYIRPLMVVSQERFPVEVVKMPHPIPKTVKLVMMVTHASGIDLEWDKSRAAKSLYLMQVTPIGICFVGTYSLMVNVLAV